MIKYALIVGFLIGAYWFGSSNATTQAKLEATQYKLEAEKAYNELLTAKLEEERQYNERIQTLEKAHAEELTKLHNDYDKTVANLRRNFNPSGVRKCTSDNAASGKNKGANELVCYTKHDLLARVEGTLAFGARCDRLAAKYNTLLRVIEEYNAKK